jgi:trans-2-enoyl-CoA reductase
MARKVKKAFAFKNDIKGDELSKLKFSIGFSDDDIKNIETIKNKINKLELIIYSTNTGSKEKI